MKLWDFMGWDTKDARNTREEIRGKWGFYTTLAVMIGLCVFGFVVWG